MARIGSADTSPELAVRRLLHRLGYRFRLHRRSLPGTPDLCFPARRKAIFVHGCFWHRHEGCRRTTTPKTRTAFWKDKFRKNVERDGANLRDLRGLGWSVMIVWECETSDLGELALRLAGFLDDAASRWAGSGRGPGEVRVLPACDAPEVVTDFRYLDGPGFFPVHSGRLAAGLSRRPVRVVIFGTDWGARSRYEECREAAIHCGCRRSLRPTAETGDRPYRTESNLLHVLTDADVDLSTVFLSNAVLALANDQTNNERVFGRYHDYLRDCADWHRRWLEEQRPRLAVLMGAEHLKLYRFIWSRIWPDLFRPSGAWHRVRSLKQAFESNLTVVRAAPGLHVQLMYHPACRDQRLWRESRLRTVPDLRQWG